MWSTRALCCGNFVCGGRRFESVMDCSFVVVFSKEHQIVYQTEPVSTPVEQSRGIWFDPPLPQRTGYLETFHRCSEDTFRLWFFLPSFIKGRKQISSTPHISKATEIVILSKVKLNGACATTPAISRRFIIAEVRITSKHNPCGICGGQMVPRQYITQILRFSLANYHSTNSASATNVIQYSYWQHPYINHTMKKICRNILFSLWRSGVGLHILMLKFNPSYDLCYVIKPNIRYWYATLIEIP